MFRSEFLKSLFSKKSFFSNKNKNVDLKKILTEVDSHLEKLSVEQKNQKMAVDLGFEEMQKVWNLINERENLIKSILDSSQDIIITLNEKAEIIEFNHTAENIFGQTKNEVQGHSIFTVIKGGTLLDDLIENLQKKINEEKNAYFAVSHERNVVDRSGALIPVSVFLSRVVSNSSVIYPLYMRDLSQIKRAQLELEKSRAQVVFSSKLSSLGEMAGGIAHEINTPLAIIQMRTDQLLEHVKNKTMTDAFLLKALGGVDVTVKRIAKIVRSLRAFARDGSQDPASACLIDTLIEETFGLCREKFYHNGVKLEYKSANPIELNCRSNEILQVLLNMLNNAFDAIENNSEKWIFVETSLNEKNQLIIQMTDSGKGIPPHILEKLMTPFFTTKEIGKGTGLGLSISKGIVESHGGRIYVDTRCENTRFVIELPSARYVQVAS